MIPYGKHSIERDDVDAVVDILENQFLTQGPKVEQFEQALCDYSKARHAIVVNSGTSALHVACLSLGVTNGDIVWTVSNSFVASANCALYCGADIDFVDIDSQTRNISISALQAKLIEAELSNGLPKVLVVVHFAGFSCDMKSIAELAKKYSFAVIEDASHALGATYLCDNVGSCRYSDICVYSFHPVKSITTAEGGAVLTSSPQLAKNAALYAKHGITKEHDDFIEFDKTAWNYEQQVLGFNYRLSDLHAALGISQLKKLDQFIDTRRSLAARYLEKLSSLPIKLPILDDNTDSSWHLFVIELLEHDRETIFNLLRSNKIGVNVHYIPIHTQPYYQNMGFDSGLCPNSVLYYERAISLPLFPLMTESQQDFVIDTLSKALV